MTAAATDVPPAGATFSGPPAFGELVWTFFRIGLLSFGGAAGQIAMMHRIVVDEKRWLDERRYLHALNYCMLLPGPEAQQLATYIGWAAHGVRGGVVAGVLFVLPGALLMLGLSFLFLLGSGVALIDGLFFGVTAAVLAIVAQALIKIAKRGVKGVALRALAVAAFAAILFLNLPFPAIVLGAAALGAAMSTFAPSLLPSGPADEPPAPPQRGRARRAAALALRCLAVWLAPIAAAALLLGPGHVVVEIGLFFSKLALLTFGGAYAVLGWLTQEAVAMGWVTAEEMIAGLGLAETTPGPTILVNQFVAFLAALRGSDGDLWTATAGAAMATWATFAPSFLFIFAGAPYVDDLRRDRRLAGALAGVTAAVVGVIAFVAVWFALNTLFDGAAFAAVGPFRAPVVDPTTLDLPAAALAALAALMTFRFGLGMAATVGALAALGAAARLAGL
jgi:chromate transporter